MDEVGDNLRHPKLFIDPQSGSPHVFATDLDSCHFQILELDSTIEEEGEDLEKRRRQIIILRHRAAIALRPDLPLAKGKLVVGSGLKVLMHWDAEIDGKDGAVNYLELDEDGRVRDQDPRSRRESRSRAGGRADPRFGAALIKPAMQTTRPADSAGRFFCERHCDLYPRGCQAPPVIAPWSRGLLRVWWMEFRIPNSEFRICSNHLFQQPLERRGVTVPSES